jgi:hypothetical protein
MKQSNVSMDMKQSNVAYPLSLSDSWCSDSVAIGSMRTLFYPSNLRNHARASSFSTWIWAIARNISSGLHKLGRMSVWSLHLIPSFLEGQYLFSNMIWIYSSQVFEQLHMSTVVQNDFLISSVNRGVLNLSKFWLNLSKLSGVLNLSKFCLIFFWHV